MNGFLPKILFVAVVSFCAFVALTLGVGARYAVFLRTNLASSITSLASFTEPGFRIDGSARATPAFDFPGIIKALHPEGRYVEIETVRGTLRLESIDKVIPSADRLVYKIHLTAAAEVNRTTFVVEEGIITGFSVSDAEPLSGDFRELKQGDAVRVVGLRRYENDGKYIADFVTLVDFTGR